MIIRHAPPVLIPKNAPAPVRYAAKELSRCLSVIFSEESPVTENHEGFHIALDPAGASLPAPDAFRLGIVPDGIRVLSGTPRGIVYGVWGLLERMGCRFLAGDCEILTPGPVTLEEGVRDEIPAFYARELFWRDAMDGAFAVKLRLNSARSTITPEMGGKLGFYNFSHSFDALVPPGRWFDTHPEYFSMVDGARRRERTQLCLTNPDVLKLCVDGVKKWARENPDRSIFSVAMNDWYSPCACPECAAVDAEEGSQAGTMIRFVNKVAEEAEKEFPGIMIHTFAYLYCRKPPRVTRPRHNVIVRLCSIECCFAHPIRECGCQSGSIDVQYGSARAFRGEKRSENAFLRDLKGWSRICDHLYIWDYTTNYANYLLPFPNLGALRENLRLFRDYHVKGVFEQGNFSLGKVSALGALKAYLIAKWLWDPDLDEDVLTKDFVTGYYGPAAGPMLEYVSLWRHACGPDDHAGIYDTSDAPYLTDARLSAADALLKKALDAAGDKVYRERVERERLSVRYAVLTRLPLDTPGRDDLIDAFARDARALGITELFERKSMDSSVAVMKTSRYALDRSGAEAISYPI